MRQHSPSVQSRLLIVLCLAASACASQEAVTVCEYWVLPAVKVEITDVITGNTLTDRAVGQVREGAYSDSLQSCGSSPTDSASRCAAWERPGTYEVEVRHPGYEAWAARGVVATKGACHVNTVALKAKLVRTP